MSHISGHWEQEPAVGASSNPYSLGTLSLTSFRDFQILFFNNLGTKNLNRGDQVGFHLQLIPIENLQCDGAQFFGIAYDVIPIAEHTSLDGLVQTKFKKKIEDLLFDDPNDTANMKQDKANWYKALKPEEQDVFNQSEEYKKTKSYDILYKQAIKYDPKKIKENGLDELIDYGRQKWISDNVKNYKDVKPLTLDSILPLDLEKIKANV